MRDARRLRDAMQVLCPLAATGDASRYERAAPGWCEEDWEAAGLAASMHGISQLLHRRLGQVPGLPGDRGFRERLAEQHRLNARRFALQRAECLGAVAAIEAAGIPVLVLKGMVHAHWLYDRPEERPMNDTDLLVRPADFPVAARAVEASGLRPLKRDERHLVFVPAGDAGYLHAWSDHPENRRSLELHEGLTLEPLFVPVVPGWDLWEEARRRRAGEREVLGLAAPDAAALLALGITEDLRLHRFRLIKALDLGRLADRLPPDLDLAVWLRARGLRVARYAYPAFALAARHLPGSRCAGIAHRLEAFAGRGLRRWVAPPDAWLDLTHACPLPAHGTLLPSLRVIPGFRDRLAAVGHFLTPPREFDGLDPEVPGRRRWGAYYAARFASPGRRLRSLLDFRISPRD